MGGGQFCAKMSDGEVETPVEAPAPAVGEPLDLMSALQMVLKKSMACHSLLRGLHEVARTIEKGEAQLVVLAQDCDNGDYVKLVEGLCKEKSISLLKVPKKEQLGEWCGLCKIDEEGNPPRSSSAPAPPSGTTERRPRTRRPHGAPQERLGHMARPRLWGLCGRLTWEWVGLGPLPFFLRNRNPKN